MKEGIKKTLFLLLAMGLFISSQEKECAGKLKCAAVPVVVENIIDNNSPADADIELPLMPISRFILLQ